MSDPARNIVVLGGGQAGAWAAKTLRDEGFGADIFLISGEAHAPYERPPLSKGVLSGEVPAAATQVFRQETLQGLALHWRRGVEAAEIDRVVKAVRLTDGSRIAYDRLIICTGGRAHRPAIEGVDQAGVHTLRTLDDCDRMARALSAARTVCVIGGGWVGLEVASTATRLRKKVTLLERGDALCKRALPRVAGEHLLNVHRSAGVEVRLSTSASRVDRTSSGLRVATSDGPVDCDMVVIGAGLIPNDELAVRAGLACDGGIHVNAYCQTSDPDIFAAGDVAVAHNEWAGGMVRLESWQNAREQAVAAARNALGARIRYEPLPWFWSDQHGQNIQMLGWQKATHKAVVRRLERPGAFLTFLLHDDIVEGIVAVNAPKELRASRKLIAGRLPARESDLADPDIALTGL